MKKSLLLNSFVYFYTKSKKNLPCYRVFEECLTYGGEMDYKTYLDFVLALENRKEPQVEIKINCRYFF